MSLVVYTFLIVYVIFIACGLCEVSAVQYAVTPSNQTVLLQDDVTLDCCLLGMGGHTFVWQAFYDRGPSELIFERGPNNASSVETPSKFSVRCNSGLEDSLCCNLTIHKVMAEDLGQPITCYGYRFDPSEPGQDKSPSVYLTNEVETPRTGLSAKMIGLVVAAAVCVVAIVGVAVFKLRKGCSAPDNQPVILQVMDDYDTEEDML
ncbi:Hypp4103 [Branchiostoma lanceolatum]|uniref:Hypp4103 protein n=1 Tax=Branchiostoma lanceolatum TaxID=7740 RepID=A0A8K0F084_BRALA|nr:Hypp4103 [Branchiostoma lanceolatum]